MRNALVTGGAGFIGSNFIRHLQAHCPDVRIVNLDVLTYAGSLENLSDLPHPDRHVFVEGDIADEPLVRRLIKHHDIDTIVNFAAESHVDRSIDSPAAFIQTNIVGTFNLLEAARACWLGATTTPGVRFHHVSTDEVYGALTPDDPPFCETTPYLPSSPYSAAKAASDHLVRAYGHTYGLSVTLSNCSNNYGPYQFPEKLIPLTIFNAVRERPLPVYGDGQQIRDWLHVSDHCAGIRLVLERGQPGQTYLFGGGNQPANLDVVRTLCSILDQRRPRPGGAPHHDLIEFVTDRRGHDRRYAVDASRATRELAWTTAHDLHTGLESTVDWYLGHTEWLQKICQDSDLVAWLAQRGT